MFYIALSKVLLLFAFWLWLFCTLAVWAVPFPGQPNKPTLLSVLISQLEYVKQSARSIKDFFVDLSGRIW